ncbi:hypothetical protein DRN94_003275 [archaeon]|nr:hypothetical protein [archaeon]
MSTRPPLTDAEFQFLLKLLLSGTQTVRKRDLAEVDVEKLEALGLVEIKKRGRQRRATITVEGVRFLWKWQPDQLRDALFLRLETLAGQVDEMRRTLEQLASDLRAVLAGVGILASREQQLSEEKFFRILTEEYQRLVKTSPIAPYVLVGDLRRRVLQRLPITREQFDETVLRLHRRDPFRIQLETGTGLNPNEGIVAPRGLCYYILVKSK